ncbi:MAG: hypothetical protein ABIK99_05495 [candidate division WOR-3 bacterium]
MNGADLLGILVILFFAILQAFRGRNGFGKPFLEMLGVIITAAISVSWYPGLARAVGLPESSTLLILFLVIGFIFFIGANVLANFADISSESWDSLLSFFLGIGLGWAVCHILFRFLLLIYGRNSNFGYAVEDSWVAKEVLEFRSFKALVSLLYRARLGPELEE